MSSDKLEINGYIQNKEGKWVLTEESKKESMRMYYSGRLAYDPADLKFAIGSYNEHGEVILFKPWVS